MPKKTLESGEILYQCVYNKKHIKTFQIHDQSAIQDGMAFCEIDGGAMLATKATVRR